MINYKTKKDFEKMKKSGAILAKVKRVIYDFLKPGITTKMVDDIAYKTIIKLKAKPAFLNYNGFPGTICISINEEMIHGIPSQKIIKDGDLVKIDCGVIFENFYSDSAFTKAIGTKNQNENKRMIKIAKDAFYAGFNAIIPNKSKVGDVCAAIEKEIRKNKAYYPFDYTGHGIGKNLHEDPSIPNYYDGKKGKIIKNGMAICIEPMIMQTSHQVDVLNDNWTVVACDGKKTAHYEHTIIIEDNQAKIITGDI